MTTEGYRDRRKTTEYVSRQTHLFCRLENFDFKQYCLFRAIIHATKRTGKICSRSCTRLRSTRQAPRPCDRPANSHQGDPNSLSSLSRAGSMVIQQDNTRHQPRSTSSSIKPHRRLHRNTRTPNVSLHFEHTYISTHISADNQYTPASKTADLTKTAPRSFAGQLLRSLKPSTNIDYLPLFHIKHCLKSHKLTPLNPSALPHDRRQSKDKTYRAVQAHAFPPSCDPFTVGLRNVHRSPCNFASIWTHFSIARNTRQQQSLSAQCRAAAQAPL